MPNLARITATFFTDLLTRLGIRPPFGEGFLLSNVVLPVSIVDSGVTLTAVAVPADLTTIFNGGQSLNVTPGQRLAFTGGLSAGTYRFAAIFGNDDASLGRSWVIARRNSSDTADIWQQMINTGNQQYSWTETIADNEGIEVRVGPTGGSLGATWQASVAVTQL